MITVITSKRLKQLEEIEQKEYGLSTRLCEVHRWLSEYDWLLMPFWKFVFDGTSRVEMVREEMRTAYKLHLVEKFKEWDTQQAKFNKTIDERAAFPKNTGQTKQKKLSRRQKGRK